MAVPETMLAAQVIEYNKPYVIQQIPTPGKTLHQHDLLVKVAVASLCHTDSMVAEGQFGTQLPVIASHEASGVVVDVGASVTGFQKGDRVMVAIPYHRCGTCEDCKGPENYRQYCSNIGGHNGVTRDGGFAEYMICDARESSKLPDGVTFETAAPLACAGVTVWRGVLQAELNAGQWLAIIGSGGGLGHLGIQFAKAKGLRVIGIDARDEGIELSKKFGADIVIDARSGQDSVVQEVAKVTNDRRAEATVNVSDHADAAGLACAVTRLHGTMVQIAQPEKVCIPFNQFVFRDVRVKGSLVSSKAEAADMLNTVAELGIEVNSNIFHGLHQIPKLVELAHSGKMAGKGMIVVDEEAVKKQIAS
ncbi:MAG: hypothetical protein Q9227_003523 [Pyrenula ochraceoflavens]